MEQYNLKNTLRDTNINLKEKKFMCECQSIDQFFVCTDKFSDIFSHAYNIKNNFTNYILEETPCDEAHPEFKYSESYYICTECQQAWHFECTPNMPTSPIFGIKIPDLNHRLNQNKINSVKQFLIVLTHKGVSADKCTYANCTNYSLNGIKICLNHFGYGYES